MKKESIEKYKKNTTIKKLRFLRGAHSNESQYVKYCGMEETTKVETKYDQI